MNGHSINDFEPLPIPLAPPMDDENRRLQLLRNPSQMHVARNTHVLTQQELTGLRSQGFSKGLAQAVAANRHHFALFIWVVDNSGSMSTSDGHRFVETHKSNDVKCVSCTRWEEIQQTITYHVRMAAVTHDPTIFRLLNDPGSYYGPQFFGVGLDDKSDEMFQADVEKALRIIQNVGPSGVTPLADHIVEIRKEVSAMKDNLSRSGKRVTIILATDGIPTDSYGYEQKGEFISALRSLEGLPLWVVIRLCTDDDDVVQFYNSLDDNLELSLEVLDDFASEAHEVNEHNPWLNYTLALHRCREMGFYHRVFDMIDEKALTKSELREYVRLIFGETNIDGLPDPEFEWSEFCKKVNELSKKEPKQYNPITRKVEPWINVKKMNKVYGNNACIIS